MKKTLLVLVMVLAYSPLVFADWSGLADDQLISYFPGTTGDYGCYSIRIIAAPNGALYSAWAQGKTLRPYEINFSKSTDNGRTWNGSLSDRRISASDSESVLSYSGRAIGLAVGGNGNIYIVWPESLTNVGCEIMFLKSTDGGETWINSDVDYPISFQGGLRPFAPKIAVDNNYNIHVIWQQSGGATSEIYYGFSSDNGDTWTSLDADRIISFPDGNSAQSPEIAIDNSDNIYVVWQEKAYSDSNLTVHFGRKPAAESQFSSETADIPISLQHAGSDLDPSIAITPNGSIHVVWEARNSGEGGIYYSRSIDGGATWSGLSEERFVDFNAFDDSSCTDPAIVTTSQGNLAVCYTNWSADTDDDFIRPRVSISTDNGDTWSGNISAEVISRWDSSDDRPGYTPNICVSAGDTLHVIWREDCNDIGGSSGYYEVMYSRGDVLAIATPNPGTISGIVHETDGTTPIADVIVETFDDVNTLVAVDTTNGAGTYQASVAPGTYREHFSKPDYSDVDLLGITVASDSTTNVAVTMTPASGCQYIPGDINGNGFANGIDVTFGVTFFKGGNAPPDTCFDCPSAGQTLLAAGDVNGNCSFNGIDITYYVAYLKAIQPSLQWCEDCPPAARRR